MLFSNPSESLYDVLFGRNKLLNGLTAVTMATALIFCGHDRTNTPQKTNSNAQQTSAPVQSTVHDLRDELDKGLKAVRHFAHHI